MFGFLKRKRSFFSEEENRLIVEAIRSAEQNTSGEVRVFVEGKCAWMDALDRASELFFKLQMERTAQRNAVLVYVAVKDRQLAVYGDEGIHQKLGDAYWTAAVNGMLQQFNRNDYAKGIADCVIKIGEALKTHFPYDRETDKNELPDEIIFGK